MNISYSIRIVDSQGDGAGGVRVAVHYPWAVHDSDYTDDQGWVSFEKDVPMGNGVRVEVYVDGERVGDPWVEDGETFSYARP